MSSAGMSYEGLVLGVREVWADVLGSSSIDSVPLDVNFFDIGGNSLLLVMLWEQLQPLASHPVKLSELFQHGTVQAQAQLLHQEPEATEKAASGEPASRSLLARRRAAGIGGPA